MTTEELMKLADVYVRLNAQTTAPGAGDARQALLDALQSQAERINALEREIERLTESLRYEVDCVAAIGAERDDLRVQLDALQVDDELVEALKNDVFSYKVAWETVCDGAKDVVSDLEKARAELAAIRARKEELEQFIDLQESAPAAKDAGLVADGALSVIKRLLKVHEDRSEIDAAALAKAMLASAIDDVSPKIGGV